MFMTKFIFIFVFICILLSACTNEIQGDLSDVEEALKGVAGNEWKIAEDNPKIVDGKVLLQWSSDYKDNKAYSYDVLFSADGEFGDLSRFKTDTKRGRLRCDAEERGVCPGIVYIKVDSQQVMQFEHNFERTITEMIIAPDDVLKINYLQDSRYKILACAAGQCNESTSFGLDNTVDVTFYPMHLKFDGLHTFNEELFIEYKVQNSEGVLVSLNEYDDKTTATLNDKTWLLPFISTEGVLTIQACLDSNDDNCQDYVSFNAKASTKRYITAFDDGTVLANASGAYTGSKLLAVYDRTTRKISFLAADQNCSKDGIKQCTADVSDRNGSYLHWSVLNTINESEEVYSLAISKSKLFVGLANSSRVQVYDISVNDNSSGYAVALKDLVVITPPNNQFSQFGFSLAVVNDGNHLVVGSPADNKIAVYDIDDSTQVTTSADFGSFGFSLVATDSGFYVGAPFANQVIPYTVNNNETATSDNETATAFKTGTSITPTADTTKTAYYGYSIASIASKNNELYVTDPEQKPEQKDVLNQDGTKSSFTDRISQQHPSILTVCENDNMQCKVKVKEDVANKTGYADFITASSMKDADIFVVDTQDTLYISHDLTADSYFIKDGLLKTITCNDRCAVTPYSGDPIAFEDIHGTGEDGKVYNYSNILFGFDTSPTAEVSSNLYMSSYKEYNGSLYKNYLFAFNAEGNYLGSTYYGYNDHRHDTVQLVAESNHYIHEKKLYVSELDSYTNSQFVWDDEGDNFLFCSSTRGATNCQTDEPESDTTLYVAKAQGDQYFVYANEVYKAPDSNNTVVPLVWNADTNAENFFWCEGNTGTSPIDCQTSESDGYPNLYVATLNADKHFLHVNGAATQTYQVTDNTTLAEAYNNYIICYDGVTAIYTQDRQNIYECQSGVPTGTSRATDSSWPKYEVYANHTLYKDGQKASDRHWCGGEGNQFGCNQANGEYGEHNSEEGYMQFTNGKQTQSGLQNLFNRAMVNGRWYNGEKDKHSSYTGRGRDGDNEEWEHGYCKDGYHDSNPWWFGYDDQCMLESYRFDEQ